MNNDLRSFLWDAINDYAAACGGYPDKHVYGNVPRQNAVAKIERIVKAVEKAAIQLGHDAKREKGNDQ